MLPDGTLVPWVSDGGKAMEIAAAQPDIPWTDLAYSLLPNGHTLDYVADAPYLQRGRIGVMKQSFVAGPLRDRPGDEQLRAARHRPRCGPRQLVRADQRRRALRPEPARRRTSSTRSRPTTPPTTSTTRSPPAPLLISNGWTDDLFPPDEAIRFYNRTRTEHPGAPISLIFSDHGHQRGQNKAADAELPQRTRSTPGSTTTSRARARRPFQGVADADPDLRRAVRGATGAFDDADADQPFPAPTWAAARAGRGPPHRCRRARRSRPTVSEPRAPAQAFDPIAGGGACATALGRRPARRRQLPPPEPPGRRLHADGLADGRRRHHSRRAEPRSSPPGCSTSARAATRPWSRAGSTGPRSTPAASRPARSSSSTRTAGSFEAGHVAKLELLPADQPYGRNSNGQAPITVSNLELRLPVLESPGGGVVQSPAPKVVPAGLTTPGRRRDGDASGVTAAIARRERRCP